MRISEKVKDDIYLLAAGLCCAFLAAKFWGFFQFAGFDILYVVVIVGLVAQNSSLKKKVRELERGAINK
jgi:hypothetical protein